MLNSKKAPGIYKIKVKGMLPDSITTAEYLFDIKISTFQPSQPSFLPEAQLVEII
jgi:hypothetical protein